LSAGGDDVTQGVGQEGAHRRHRDYFGTLILHMRAALLVDDDGTGEEECDESICRDEEDGGREHVARRRPREWVLVGVFHRLLLYDAPGKVGDLKADEAEGEHDGVIHEFPARKEEGNKQTEGVRN